MKKRIAIFLIIVILLCYIFIIKHTIVLTIYNADEESIPLIINLDNQIIDYQVFSETQVIPHKIYTYGLFGSHKLEVIDELNNLKENHNFFLFKSQRIIITIGSIDNNTPEILFDNEYYPVF